MGLDRTSTLLDYFHALERKRGTCVVYDDGLRTRRYDYAAVTSAARGFAARLAAHGARKGDRVLFWSENRPEWLVAYWGCLLTGVVIVPIDYRASLAFLRKVRGIVGARLILAGDDVHALAPEDGEVWRMGDLDWKAAGPAPDVAIDRDDLTQIIFTSGATAEPKGVLIRHRNSLANIVPVEREITKYKKYARPVLPLRFLNLLPLSHMFGQALATDIPPMVDGTVVFMRSTNPHDVVRMVKEHRVSVIVCVPKMLDVLKAHVTRMAGTTEVVPSISAADTGERRRSILARWWRYRRVHRAFGLKFWAFVVGGAPLPPALETFWRRLGFLVIQGYGLTETAPIVTLNHPLRTRSGSVGTPIEGVEVRIAEDGEILVRGENVTSGYYEGGEAVFDEEGWFHTGDLGERDAEGRLFIKGRKKELIVTPEGLNVFPDDVEVELNGVAGVKESAAVGAMAGGGERVHAVLVLEDGADPDAIIREANTRLQDHQRIRGYSVWPDGSLPRTEGTRKLKRSAIRSWVEQGARPDDAVGEADPLARVLGRFVRGPLDDAESLDALGLSSLERMEVMVALEDALQTRLDEARFAEARTMEDLRELMRSAPDQPEVRDLFTFPSWNRHPLVGFIRRISQATWILPPMRLFMPLEVKGLGHLRDLEGPVIFAANHQSHLDGPAILSALPPRWRRQVAPAMSKEFFKAHFFPSQHSWFQVMTNRLNYYLAAFFFNGFPLPQREAGARQTLRYVAEITSAGFSLLLFPEGVRTADGTIRPFFSGVGLMASRLELPVVPIRIDGLHKVLPTGQTWPTRGPVTVTFGAPMRLSGHDYADVARRVEDAVRAL